MITDNMINIVDEAVKQVTEINLQCNLILTLALVRGDRDTKDAVVKILDANKKLIEAIKK